MPCLQHQSRSTIFFLWSHSVSLISFSLLDTRCQLRGQSMINHAVWKWSHFYFRFRSSHFICDQLTLMLKITMGHMLLILRNCMFAIIGSLLLSECLKSLPWSELLLSSFVTQLHHLDCRYWHYQHCLITSIISVPASFLFHLLLFYPYYFNKMTMVLYNHI